jgi:hypothetical protein
VNAIGTEALLQRGARFLDRRLQFLQLALQRLEQRLSDHLRAQRVHLPLDGVRHRVAEARELLLNVVLELRQLRLHVVDECRRRLRDLAIRRLLESHAIVGRGLSALAILSAASFAAAIRAGRKPSSRPRRRARRPASSVRRPPAAPPPRARP